METKTQTRAYEKRKFNLGYRKAQLLAPMPGYAVGTALRGHEFHYSSVVEDAFAGTCAYEVRRGYGIDGAKDGVIVKNTLATYLHQRHTQSNPWVAQFLDYVETVRTGEFNVD